MPLCLQGHTLEISHTVKYDEASALCRIYGIPDSSVIEITRPNIPGINAITIRKNPVVKDGVLVRHTYKMTVQVNISRLLNKGNVAMADLKKNNVADMTGKLSRIFRNKLHLSADNSNAGEWTLSRLDCGVDLHIGIEDAEVLKLYLRLLHKGFTMNRGFDYTKYKGYDRPEVKSESVTINKSNQNSKYNIYYKLLELLKSGNNATQPELDGIRDVIRIEKQLNQSRALNELTKDSKKLSVLLDEESTFALMGNIVSEIKELFGSGEHVSHDEAVRRIESSPYREDEKSRLQVIYAGVNTFGYYDTFNLMVGQYGLEEKECRSMMNKYRKKIESLGISIAGLSDEDVELLGTTRLQSIGNILQRKADESSQRKSKGQFGSIRYDEKNGRWKCNFTYHDITGVSRRTTVAGKKGESSDEVEMKILEFIRSNLNRNYKANNGNPHMQIQCAEWAKEEIEKFRTTVTRKGMLELLDRCIYEIDERIGKLQGYMADMEDSLQRED